MYAIRSYYESGKSNQAPKLDVSVRTGFSAPRAKFDIMTDPQLIGELLWLEMKNDGLTPTHAHFGSGSVPKLNDYLYVITSYSIHYTKLYEVSILR